MKNCEFYFEKARARGQKSENIARYIFGVNLLLAFLAIRTVIDGDIAVVHLGIAYMAVFMLLGFFAHAGQEVGHER